MVRIPEVDEGWLTTGMEIEDFEVLRGEEVEIR
jgi:hypothetical protein